MGCGQSRDVQTPISQLVSVQISSAVTVEPPATCPPNKVHITSHPATSPKSVDAQVTAIKGSHGSSAEDDDVANRTWGSPAPILPSISNGKSLVYEDEPFPVPEPTTKGTGGVAFYVGEKQPVALPPRRLQTLNGNRLSMDELLRKQREAEMRHNQHLQDKMKSSEEHKSKRRINEKKGFDKAMAQYNEIEKKLERGEEKRKSIIKQKVEKTRLHHAKVSKVRTKSITDDGLELSCNIEADTEYNKSESESWDNESIKNIYDQMEYITPVSGLTKNTLGNESDEDFFS